MIEVFADDFSEVGRSGSALIMTEALNTLSWSFAERNVLQES